MNDLRTLAEKALELAGKATAGPWIMDPIGEILSGQLIIATVGYQMEHSIPNGELLAFSRSALPELARAYLDLAEQDQMRSEVADHCIDLQSRLSEAEARLEMARDTLRFYADEQANYDNDGIVYQNASHPFDADPDYGRLARQALAKLEGK